MHSLAFRQHQDIAQKTLLGSSTILLWFLASRVREDILYKLFNLRCSVVAAKDKRGWWPSRKKIHQDRLEPDSNYSSLAWVPNRHQQEGVEGQELPVFQPTHLWSQQLGNGSRRLRSGLQILKTRTKRERQSDLTNPLCLEQVCSPHNTVTALVFSCVPWVWCFRSFRFLSAGSWPFNRRSLELCDLSALLTQILIEPHRTLSPVWFGLYLQKLLGKHHSGSLPDSIPQSNILSAGFLRVHTGSKCGYPSVFLAIWGEHWRKESRRHLDQETEALGSCEEFDMVDFTSLKCLGNELCLLFPSVCFCFEFLN